jgi:hypothetical protein
LFDTETNTHYAYLSVLTYVTGKWWRMVRKGAGYVFKDMARNAVYLPVFIPKGIILLLIIL